MSRKNSCRKIAVTLYKCSLFEKFVMIANILFHDWRLRNLFESDFHHEFYNVSDEEILSALEGLDSASLANARKYVSRQRDILITPQNHTFFFYNCHRLFGKTEINAIDDMLRRHRKELKKYKVDTGFYLGGPESLVYHHGLSDCPEPVKAYLREGVFLDVGGCYGDSALVLLNHYAPQKVITFEPSAINRRIYRDIMKKNGIPESKYELSSFGLGKECSTIYYCENSGFGNSLKNIHGRTTQAEITTLDQFCSEHNLTNVKFLKADIEGMELDMLQGARTVIEQNRPVLSICIYHSREEFFGVYKTLKSWNLDYCFSLKLLHIASELVLFAWPKELNER